MIATSCARVILNKVSGTPIWLFKFPCVYATLYRRLSTAAVSSLVVVLPFVPVMARNGISNVRLHARAKSCNSAKAFSPLMIYSAPSLRACSTKSFPSKCSPLSATKIEPGVTFRLSVVTQSESLFFSKKLQSIRSYLCNSSAFLFGNSRP